MTEKIDAWCRLAYRFKPGRTFAQALGAALVGKGVGVLDVDWRVAISLAAMAGLLSFLQAWADGSSLIASEAATATDVQVLDGDPLIVEAETEDEGVGFRLTSPVQDMLPL